MPSLAIENNTHWHMIRRENVGASEVAALFEVSPYQTRFQLWHEKAGNTPPSFHETEPMRWGNRLETAIALGIAEDQGLKVVKCKDYWLHETVKGMGATPDFIIEDKDRGPGIFEIKNVGWDQWKAKWFNDAGEIEPPIDYELQVQHQMACTGYTHASFGVLVGGRESYKIDRPRHEKAISMIEAAVTAFWESIANSDEPEPFNQADYATVLALFGSNRKETADFNGHALLPALCESFLIHGNIQRQAKKDYELAKTKILNIIRGAESAQCYPYQLKFSKNRLTITNVLED